MLPVLIAAGIGIQAYGSYRASQARAAQARENARRARMLASDALARGEIKAGVVELASSRRQGQQIVGYAHGGVDVGTGSAATTISTTAMIGDLEARIQRLNAFRVAWGYETQATGLEEQAEREEDAALYNALGTIVGGAGQFGGGGGPSAGASGWSDTMPSGGTDYFGETGVM